MYTNHLNRRQTYTHSDISAVALAGASAVPNASSSSSTNGTTIITTTTVAEIELFKTHKAIVMQMNRGFTVSVVDQSAADIAAMFAAGNLPDLLCSRVAPSVPNLAGRGLLENLDHYIATSSLIKVDDLQPTNDVYRWNGKTLGQRRPRHRMVKIGRNMP